MCAMGASVSGLIGAPAEAIWELVSDPTRHPELAGSGEVQAVEILGGGPMARGTVFQSQQRMRGMSYVTANRVLVWEPPLRFVWRVGFPFAPGIAQSWSFVLTPEEGGTRVENGVLLAYSVPAIFPFSLLRNDICRREASVILPTLVKLAQIVGAPPPSKVVERREPPAALVALKS